MNLSQLLRPGVLLSRSGGFHVALVPLFFCFAGLALAQATDTAPRSLEACTALRSDSARLACYDEVAHYQPPDSATVFVDKQRTADAKAGPAVSLLTGRWELTPESKLGVFQIRGYKPIYVLPLVWTSDPNRSPSSPNPNASVTSPLNFQNMEAKFQLGLKTKLLQDVLGSQLDVWGGYTQNSRWQVYNGALSRPFRETDYEPEVFVVMPTSYHLGGWDGRMLAAGLNHQSNGRTSPLSRSWNRLMFNVGLDRQYWSLNFRPWIRLRESRGDDDNPDIEDYVGRADATLIYSRFGHEVSMTARHSLRGGDRSHGSLALDWGIPLTKNLRGHLQLFDGYGESLIDYNHRAFYIGLGVSLLEWY